MIKVIMNSSTTPFPVIGTTTDSFSSLTFSRALLQQHPYVLNLNVERFKQITLKYLFINNLVLINNLDSFKYSCRGAGNFRPQLVLE